MKQPILNIAVILIEQSKRYWGNSRLAELETLKKLNCVCYRINARPEGLAFLYHNAMVKKPLPLPNILHFQRILSIEL